MSNRPTCAYCGKPLAKHIERHFFDAGKEPASIEALRRSTSHEILSIGWRERGTERITHTVGDPPYQRTYEDWTGPVKRFIAEYRSWDGQSYRGYPRGMTVPPFCSLSCGMMFGAAAHRAGYRITEKGS